VVAATSGRWFRSLSGSALALDYSRPALVIARVFTISLGSLAVLWAISALPSLWRQATIENLASRIINYERFKPKALVPFLPLLDAAEDQPYCRPEVLHSVSIVRMRLAEDAMAVADRADLDDRLTAVKNSIRRSLSCAPADPFLWMALAWLGNATDGFRPEQTEFLRLSYQLGPNEGWVAARRNRVALSAFSRLPPDLADDAVREFAHMVDSWMYYDTIAIITGPGWPIHDRLLGALDGVGLPQREALAKALYQRGYDAQIPGVAPHDPRPWD